jgi:transposase
MLFMEWPAPPSGIVGSPEAQKEGWIMRTAISVLGIDIGKNICSLVGLDACGKVVFRRRVMRETLIALAAKFPPCIVAMEACCGAHYLGRVFAARGHEVRLISPEYVRPYVKAQKNDDRDADLQTWARSCGMAGIDTTPSDDRRQVEASRDKQARQ